MKPLKEVSRFFYNIFVPFFSGEAIFNHITEMIPQLKSRTSQKPTGQENEPDATRKKSKKK